MRTIQLQAPGIVGDLPTFEGISAEELGPNHFRLLASPEVIPNLAEGDEFALDRKAVEGFNVLERGGNVVLWFYLPGEEFLPHPAVAELEADLEDLGGRLDEAVDNSAQLVATVPLKAGFAQIEAAFDRVLAAIEESAVQYACTADSKGARAEWLERG